MRQTQEQEQSPLTRRNVDEDDVQHNTYGYEDCLGNNIAIFVR